MPLLVNGQTATGASAAFTHTAKQSTVQATVTGAGAVSATVAVEVSNDPTNLGWLTLATLTLSGTNSATDGFAIMAPWANIRFNCSALGGSNSLFVGLGS